MFFESNQSHKKQNKSQKSKFIWQIWTFLMGHFLYVCLCEKSKGHSKCIKNLQYKKLWLQLQQKWK